MSESITVPHWICIDKPRRQRVLHYAEGCHFSRSISQIGALGPLKPVGQMGSNGGWILFPSRSDAEYYAEREFPAYQPIKLCTFCQPPTSIPLTPLASDIDLSPVERETAHIYRMLRDASLARWVKAKHDHSCQICDHRIKLKDGSGYAEAHHLQPLGEPHNGPDIIQNIICVCPNHHAELDYCTTLLNFSDLRTHPDHPLDQRFIDYHNRRVTADSVESEIPISYTE